MQEWAVPEAQDPGEMQAPQGFGPFVALTAPGPSSIAPPGQATTKLGSIWPPPVLDGPHQLKMAFTFLNGGGGKVSRNHIS